MKSAKADPLVLSVRADLFRIAARFIPDLAGCRAHSELDGVHIAPCPDGGAILVAGDETGMIVLRDPEGRATRPVTLRVPSHVLAMARDMLKGRANAPDGAIEPATVVLSVRMSAWRALRGRIAPGGGVEFDVTENALPFPEWRALVPSTATVGGALALNAAEAQRLALTSTALAQSAGMSFEIARKSPLTFFHSEARRVFVRFRHWDDAFAMVQPASLCGEKETGAPWWMRGDVTEAA